MGAVVDQPIVNGNGFSHCDLVVKQVGGIAKAGDAFVGVGQVQHGRHQCAAGLDLVSELVASVLQAFCISTAVASKDVFVNHIAKVGAGQSAVKGPQAAELHAGAVKAFGDLVNA